MPILRLALAQTNPRLGDFSGNINAIMGFVQRAASQGADIVAFGEMALTGYPIEDLATRPEFLHLARTELDGLALRLLSAGLGSTTVVVGFPNGPIALPTTNAAHSPTAIAHNAAAVLQDGRVLGIYNKHHLPNYSVFDEHRNFRPGNSVMIVHVAGCDVAIAICEDIWRDGDLMTSIADAHPGLLLVINGSPFEREKDEVRLPLVRRRAAQTGAHVAYLNLVGGQDDLVFDGDSFVVNASGKLLARSPQFVEDLLVVDLDLPASRTNGAQIGDGFTVVQAGGPSRGHVALKTPSPVERNDDSREQIWNALVLGLRDYVHKNGFPSLILGLSGGIDSAVCAALAVDAIGPDRVFGVSMPSNFSSDHSRSDADDLAERLGIDMRTEAISGLVTPIEDQLGLSDVAAENLQARIRGIILMSLSNAEGHLVLTTGNKTEIAVGYSTIYGDSVGGFAPIRDVPKTLVWELAKWRNENARRANLIQPIPEASITKPPSAELRPGQLDQDTLPEYDILDAILDAYITKRLGRDEVVALDFDAETVDRIISLVDRAEWKRRQGAIGPKISEMAFGRDRRLPVTFVRS
ncbi:MAG: NAD+ synthase [Actinomycetales bacterium]|nr:NAD+ synthase [Actinomycetales bacterium]